VQAIDAARSLARASDRASCGNTAIQTVGGTFTVANATKFGSLVAGMEGVGKRRQRLVKSTRFGVIKGQTRRSR
jgi:hypothetical protein